MIKSSLRIGKRVSVTRFVNKNTIAKFGEIIMMNTNGANRTVTMPADPERGDIVEFIDMHNSWGNNSCFVASSQKIMASTANFELDVAGGYAKFTYGYVGEGWMLTASRGGI